MKNLFHITEIKTYTEEGKKICAVCGWFDKLEKEESCLKAVLGEQSLMMEEEKAEGIRTRLKYLRVRANIDTEFTYRITLPKDFGQCNSFVLSEKEGTEEKVILKLSVKAFEDGIEKYWTPKKQKIREIQIQEGIGGFCKKVMQKFGMDTLLSYEEFRKTQSVSKHKLDGQRQEPPLKGMLPIFYILFRDVEQRVKQTVTASLQKQSYVNWKVVEDEKELPHGNGYVLLVDRDLWFSLEAFYQAYRKIMEDPAVDFLYADEEFQIESGGWTPDFKPDANEDLLRSRDYIGSFCLVKTELYHLAGGFLGNRYDYHLRCWEKAKRIVHIPKVLASNLCARKESWNEEIAKESRFALENYYSRKEIEAKTELDMTDSKYPKYHTRYEIEGNPLVSVIIPNKDHTEDLKICMDSLLLKTTYENHEVLIVENNSTEDATFAYYKELEESDSRVKVLYWKEGFNYSKINNFGVQHANGEYYIFLNNDTEVIETYWMEEMLGRCQQEDAGIVGARLYFGDGTIQHAGVIIGMGGLAGHAFGGRSKDHPGYRKYGCVMQDLSAVTAACMMVKKEVFEKAGGFCEELAVAFNDIDLCLNVRKQGKLVVYNPYAELYHHESKSRGMEDTPEKVKRFHGEVCLFAKRHPWIMKESDPYYNPNLTIDRNDFALNERI